MFCRKVAVTSGVKPPSDGEKLGGAAEVITGCPVTVAEAANMVRKGICAPSDCNITRSSLPPSSYREHAGSCLLDWLEQFVAVLLRLLVRCLSWHDKFVFLVLVCYML